MGRTDTEPATLTLPGAPAPPGPTAMVLPSWLSYSGYTTARTTRTLTTTHLLAFPDNRSRGPSVKTQTKTRTYATTEYSIVYRPLEYSGPLPAPPLGTLFTLPGDQESGSASTTRTNARPNSSNHRTSPNRGSHSSSHSASKSKSRHSSTRTSRPHGGSTPQGGFGGADSSHSGRRSSSRGGLSFSTAHTSSRPRSSTSKAGHRTSVPPTTRSGNHAPSESEASSWRTSSTEGRKSTHGASTTSKERGSSVDHSSTHRASASDETHTSMASLAGPSTSRGDHSESSVPAHSTRSATPTHTNETGDGSSSSPRSTSTSNTDASDQGKGTRSASHPGSSTGQVGSVASPSAFSSTHRGLSSAEGGSSLSRSVNSFTENPPLLSSYSAGVPSVTSSGISTESSHVAPSSGVAGLPSSTSADRSSAAASPSTSDSPSPVSTPDSSTPADTPVKSFTSSLTTDFPFLPSTTPPPTTGIARPYPSGNNGISHKGPHGADGGSNGKLSAGQIAGIAVGSFFGALAILALLTLLAWLCYRRRKRQRDPYGLEDRYTRSGLTAAEKMEAGDAERPQGLAGRFFALRSGGKGAYAAVGNNTGRGYSANSYGSSHSMGMVAEAPSAGGYDTTRGSTSAFLSPSGPRYPNGPASRSTGLPDRYASTGAGRAGVGAFVAAGMAGRRQSSKRYASETHDEDTNLLEHAPSHNSAADPYYPSQMTVGEHEPLMEQSYTPQTGTDRRWVPQGEEQMYPPEMVAAQEDTNRVTGASGWNETDDERRAQLHREGTQHTAGAETAVTSLTRETEPSTISSQSVFTAPSRDNSRSHRPSQQLLFARLSSRPGGINGPIAESDGAEAESPSTRGLGALAVAGAVGAGAGYGAAAARSSQPKQHKSGEQNAMLNVPGATNVGDETLTPSVNTASSEEDGNVLWDGKRHSPEARLAALERLSPVGAENARQVDGVEGNTTGSQTSLSSMATHDGRTDNSTYLRTIGSSSSAASATDQPSTAAQAGDTGASVPDSASASNSLGIDLGSPAASAAVGAFPSAEGREHDSDYPISSTSTSARGYDPSLLSSMGYGSSEFNSQYDPASSLATMGTSRRSRSSGVPTASSSGPTRSYASPLSNSHSLLSSQPAEAPVAQSPEVPAGLGKSLPTAPEQTYDGPSTYDAVRALGQDPYADEEEQSREHLLHPALPDLLEDTKWDTAGEYRYGEPLADIEERSLERSSQAGLSGRGSRLGGLSRQPTGTTGRGSLTSSHASGWDDYAAPHQPVWRPSPRVRTATQKAIGRLNQHESPQL